MKLKTRIILVSCGMVVIVSLITNFISWYFMKKSLRNEAVSNAYSSAINQYKELFNRIEVNDEYIQYYLNKSKNEYIACIKHKGDNGFNEELEEIYNHTVFTVEQLKDMVEGKGYKVKKNKELEYINLNYGGRKYMVFIGESNVYYTLQFEDITYIEKKIWDFRIVSISATGVLLIATVLILWRILDRTLLPLQELNENTRKIARGVYSARIETDRKDEIGQLGENFNKMAEAVEMYIANLKESEKNKTIFMGNLTHELKTPLTAISGYSQTLLNVKLSEEDEREALTYIYEECGKLERLSKKMIRLLELEENNTLDMCEESIDEIFKRAVMSCRYMLKEKNISIDIINTIHNSTITCDMDLMTEVIINLIDNSIKASSADSKIILRYTGETIEVQDYGIGIPKEEKDKILEPFYMVDKSRSRKKGGAGLGLSLVALIVRKHNMVLDIETELGKGTVFKINIS